MKRSAPLEGLTIVELGHSVAAPYAGLILADLGARVIKVEGPHGDYARDWAPPFWKDTSSTFAALNRGKLGIVADFTDPADAERLKRLILEEADVVLQNLRPGVLERFGLDGKSIRKRKESLIWCDIGAFGATGPLAAKPGYDPLVQASAGIMSVTGDRDGPPVRVGVSLVDMGSGMWAVIGILASLIMRDRDGLGAKVSTSLFETGLAWMTIPLAGFQASGDVRKSYGSGVAEIVPYQAFETKDGWLMIAAGNDHLFRRLCGVIGLAELADLPDYRLNSSRVQNRERLIPLIADAVRRYTAEELGTSLDKEGVPNAPLLTIDQVATHPQTRALGMSLPCDDDELELIGIPITFDDERPRTRQRAPKFGEHDDHPLASRQKSIRQA